MRLVSEGETLTDLRFEWDGAEALLDGSPVALRRLAQLLRDAEDSDVEVKLGDGTAVLRQVPRGGPLRISVQEHTIEVTGSPEGLNILWASLEGVADESDAERRAPVRRHAHIEYLGPGDETYRAADSVPLVIGADWPAD